ncbi:hypothetical protein B0H11DRAFT_803189 [Mycena galericulata]|nr:hypothetical protein B0H11DRAFT_803189 [Mycena galericulata]
MRALFPCLTLLLAAIDTVLSDTALPNTAAPVQLQPLGLDKAKWIWNSATPGGTRAFRKSFFAPDGKIPVRAEIICTADDAFVFFVNGREVSSSAIYKRPEYACVALAPCLNVFAIKGTDLVAGTSGVLAKVRVTYADGSTSIIVTDSSWRAAPDVQPGFENLTVDDSGWDTAHSFGDYGIAPWNKFDSSIPASDISKCEAVPTKPCPCQAVCDAPSPGPSPTGNVVGMLSVD